MPRSVAPSLARELRAALAPFGVEVGRLRRPPAGLGRATFLAGPVVVKLAPREAGDELVQRLRVLRALRPRAVAVPRPKHSHAWPAFPSMSPCRQTESLFATLSG